MAWLRYWRIPKPTVAGQVLTSNAKGGAEFAAAGGGGGTVGNDVLFDAKGDLVAGTGPNAAARVPVGVNGQILYVDSTQSTGVKWADPPAGGGGGGAVSSVNGKTGTVVLSAADVSADAAGTASSAVATHEADTTAVHGIADTSLLVSKGLVDAKGDLLVGTANDALARLAVGTDGQVLTADAVSAGGVKWATPAAGGGGSTFAPKYRTGGEYVNAMRLRNGEANLGTGVFCVAPIRVYATQTLVGLGIWVTTAGGAGAVVRLGVYNDSDMNPNALVVDAGTVDGSTSGVKFATVSVSLTPGLYWLGAVAQGAGGGTMMLHNSGSDGVAPQSPFIVAGTQFPGSSYVMNGVSGALPATFTNNGQGSDPYITRFKF